MLGKIFGVLCLVSVLFGSITSNLSAVGNAVLEGAGSAVDLTISLVGVMCLFGGIMRVLSDAGAVKKLSRILFPFLKFFFRDAAKEKNTDAIQEISACVGANLLGIGNAATPLALSAIKKLHLSHINRGGDPDIASRDMITLAVLNTASANLLPSTILALRQAAGSQNPAGVILPIQICSVCCSVFALSMCRFMGMTEKKGIRKQK